VIRTRPEFYDVDPMSIVWHGNYARFMELARVGVLNLIDYGYVRMQESGFAWPVIDMGIKYAHPIALHQEIEVEAQIVEWENRLKINFEIRDAVTARRLTRAYSVHVAVGIDDGQMRWETPPALRDRMKPWL
jgi:acyl-CoA thioester hydrolase